jgi:hypothetical protein
MDEFEQRMKAIEEKKKVLNIEGMLFTQKEE